MGGVGHSDPLGSCCSELRDERISNPDLLGLLRHRKYHTPRATTEITIPTVTKIPAVAGVLRPAFVECMLEELALVDVPDAVNDADVEPVEVVAGRDDVELGGDATANFLSITVAKEVKPEGVMVVWSARTPATLDATL